MDLPRECVACSASLLSTIGLNIVGNRKEKNAECPVFIRPSKQPLAESK